MTKTTILWVLGMILVAGSLSGAYLVLAVGGRDQWTSGRFTNGQQLEFKRDFACFGSERGGPRHWFYNVGPFNGSVQRAEVFLSGFSFWYSGRADNELHNLAVDSLVEKLRARNEPGPPGRQVEDPRYIIVKILIDLRDEDPSDSDDAHQACVGYTVIALTQP